MMEDSTPRRIEGNPKSGEIQSTDCKTSAMKDANGLEILLQSSDIGAPFVEERHDIVGKW